jgi:coproporphyrinogen III oxidase-like Fe-S oxidoreductase
LCDELEVWSESSDLGQRPVSTIHLGGGTPAFIGEVALTHLVECFHRSFAVKDKTELALETTVESLSPDMVANLHTLGFRRLHVGVQSMQDEVRSIIGRRCSAVGVLRSIEATLDQEWIVSVDLLCGLPGQTLAGFVHGIESLINVGVNGFSLYELLIRKQNFRWASQHNLTSHSHFHNYLMMHAGAYLLESKGFRKNMFNHWADEKDENIYFTFPTRGEDCLAIGTIADGVFGDYHYRHPRYADYLRANHSLSPGLEGGLKRNQLENWLHPIETTLLSGYIDPKTMKVLDKSSQEGTSVIDKWLAHAMIEIESSGWARLTTNGTWFAGNLVAELRECLKQG